MKSNTATGTTATADRKAPYRGRFAPSPTGLLHLGSLAAALASWLDARANAGVWLVRMEDLDIGRNIAGAADAILSTLETFGMVSDEPVMYQSSRHASYSAALAHLEQCGHAYRCTCSRSDAPGIYSGHCRDLHLPVTRASAIRLRLADGDHIEFDDAIQGHCEFQAKCLGDPVILRRDQSAAYQLAVVVDDATQGITDVVRGADLLESTAWQIRIGQALQLPRPRYAHIPLLLEPNGAKLAKSRRSLPVAHLPPSLALTDTLTVLGQQPPVELRQGSVLEVLGWAISHWQPARLAGKPSISLPM